MNSTQKLDPLEPRDPVAYPHYPKRPERARRPHLVPVEPAAASRPDDAPTVTVAGALQHFGRINP